MKRLSIALDRRCVETIVATGAYQGFTSPAELPIDEKYWKVQLDIEFEALVYRACVQATGVDMHVFRMAVFSAVAMVCCEAQAEPPFVASGHVPTGSGPRGIATADFNNDGHLDFATANFESVPNVSVLLGDGLGGFVESDNPLLPRLVIDLAAADFNQDGKIDLVVASVSNEGDDFVSVLLGLGDGTFSEPVQFPAGSFPGKIVVSDVNSDGLEDVIVASTNSYAVSVLFGNGDGSLAPRVEYFLGAAVASVTVGDMNGDGIPDLLASLNGVDVSFEQLAGGPVGTFGSPTDWGDTHTIYSTIAVSRLDPDDHLDVVMVDVFYKTVEVYRGNGNGTFSAAAVYSDGSTPADVAVADFYGRGSNDIAVAGDTSVKLLESLGDGTFHGAGSIQDSVGGAGIKAADFNEDGWPDLIVACSSHDYAVLLLNDTVSRNGFD
jgi:hypothetical protein